MSYYPIIPLPPFAFEGRPVLTLPTWAFNHDIVDRIEAHILAMHTTSDSGRYTVRPALAQLDALRTRWATEDAERPPDAP
jgi:hypothetical protein